ncbi:MAG: hypothetical protein SOZ00_04380 [Tidjanibacter sp.]|nr:hypothetical protein [Tidjanibacter sp.]
MKKLYLTTILLLLTVTASFGQLTKSRTDSRSAAVTNTTTKKESAPKIETIGRLSNSVLAMGGLSVGNGYAAYSLLLGFRSGKLYYYVEGETNNFILNPIDSYDVRGTIKDYHDNVFWSGERVQCRSNLTVGAIYKPFKWLGVKAGLGYGFYYNLCKDIGGGWYDNSDLSTTDSKLDQLGSLELEGGIYLTFGRFVVGGGVQYCLDSVFEPTFSIGLLF